MTETADIRTRILDAPDLILDDPTVMRALVEANDQAMGDNVVDLRGLAMDRLSGRLDRLEDTHRSVIAAAYDTLSGTQQVHRAVLRLMDAHTLPDFIDALRGDVSEILRIAVPRLLVEPSDADAMWEAAGDTVAVVPAGFIDQYVLRGRPRPARSVTLRALRDGEAVLYGDGPPAIRSEAVLRLDLHGAGAPAIPDAEPGQQAPGPTLVLPAHGAEAHAGQVALLAFGSDDPDRFAQSQGTDLLEFFGGVVTELLRRLVP